MKEFLKYNQKTGKIHWLKSPHPRIKTGSVAGNLNTDGYVRIDFKNKRYPAHHIAWFLTTGEWPKDEIDHKNKIRCDNRWSNLREATKKEQKGNTKLYSSNTSGYRGVYWHSRDKKWMAFIKADKRKFLGYFKTKLEAKRAYDKAAKAYFGEFYENIHH